MNKSYVQVDPPKVIGVETVYRGILKTRGFEPVSVEFRLWGETSRDAGLFEAFTSIFLPAAMRAGGDLVVKGPLDAWFLYNAGELIRFWNKLRPERFEKIGISAEALRGSGSQTPAQGAISCFSGGVDSCHTALQLAVGGGERLPTPLHGLCMIHGLDIPKAETAVFNSAFARSKKIADACGLRLERAWTDARKLERIFGLSWGPDFHAFSLAAVLHLYSHRYSVGIIPSTYCYDSMKLPWSSNPISDPFFSSGRFRVLHHGGHADKYDKVSVICRRPEVMNLLRVCWEGEHMDRNCGKCFKCLATQVSLVLNGVRAPGPFPEALNLSNLRRLSLKTEVNRKLFERYLKEARNAGTDELKLALEDCLAVNRDLVAYARKGRRLRRLRKKIRRIFKGKR